MARQATDPTKISTITQPIFHFLNISTMDLQRFKTQIATKQTQNENQIAKIQSNHLDRGEGETKMSWGLALTKLEMCGRSGDRSKRETDMSRGLALTKLEMSSLFLRSRFSNTI